MTPDPSDLSFETPRVKARLLCEDDLDLYLALYTDPEVMRYIGPVMGREDVLAVFEKSLGHNRRLGVRALYWRVFDRSNDDASVGLASLVREIRDGGAADVGLMLSSDVQRSSLGQHCLAAMIGNCLSGYWNLGVSEITARHVESHAAARRLVESLGFVGEGLDAKGFASWRMRHEAWVTSRSGEMWSRWQSR
ncbi:MAG: GNAT family N-acetyltransferase [Lysobacter sp.]|nr:GNAT family N-acetyltransferase [Lysobacter sp.]